MRQMVHKCPYFLTRWCTNAQRRSRQTDRLTHNYKHTPMAENVTSSADVGGKIDNILRHFDKLKCTCTSFLFAALRLGNDRTFDWFD